MKKIETLISSFNNDFNTNYEYLKKIGYTSYIKPIYFEKSKTRKFNL